MNDGFVPTRGDTKTLSVPFDISVLPLNQVTSTEMSLSTAVLMAIPQMTVEFVPAYNVLLDRVTFMLGGGTAGSSHNISMFQHKLLKKSLLLTTKE